MKKLLILLVVFMTSCSVYKSDHTIGLGTEIGFDSLVPTSDYVIYYDNATLPSLYAGIHMHTHSIESYMYLGRPATYDSSKLPSHVTLVESQSDMQSKVAELHSSNPDATYTFFVNENRFGRVITYFYSIGIKFENVTVIQVTDGTLTYTKWADLFSDASTAMKNWDTLSNNIVKTFANESNNTSFNAEDLGDNGNAYIPTTLFENYSFWLQWPELLVSDSEDLINHLAENGSRYYKVDPLKYFQSLPAKDEASVISLFGLDKVWEKTDGKGGDSGTLDGQTIQEVLDASPNPNIIITGTSTIDQAYITKTKALYGDGYDYFYKGHPGYRGHYPTDDSITILPWGTPMEAVLWAFGDDIAVLGGYQSSLYMNAPKNMKKFFYADSLTISPLDKMYPAGLLGSEVEFISLD